MKLIYKIYGEELKPVEIEPDPELKINI